MQQWGPFFSKFYYIQATKSNKIIQRIEEEAI